MQLILMSILRHEGVLGKTIYAGTSGGCSYSLSGYVPDDGWSSMVVLRHSVTQMTFTLQAQASGSGFEVSYTAADSAQWGAGCYRVFYYVQKGDAKFICHEGELQVSADPQGGVSRTADELELEAVDKAIAGVLGGEGVQSYTFETAVGRRSAERMSLEELRRHKQWLERRIRAAAAKASGRPSPHGHRKISARFNR